MCFIQNATFINAQQLNSQEHQPALSAYQYHFASYQQEKQQQQQQQTRRLLGIQQEAPAAESNQEHMVENFDDWSPFQEYAQQHSHSSIEKSSSGEIVTMLEPNLQEADGNSLQSAMTEFDNNFINNQYYQFKMKTEFGEQYPPVEVVSEFDAKPQRRSSEQYYQKDKLQSNYIIQATIDIINNIPNTELENQTLIINSNDSFNIDNLNYDGENQTLNHTDIQRDENGEVEDSLGLLQNFMTMLIDTGQLSPGISTPILPPTLSLNMDPLKPRQSNPTPPPQSDFLPVSNPEPEPEAEAQLEPETEPESEEENDIISKIIQELREGNAIDIPQNVSATTRVAQLQQPYKQPSEVVSLDNIQAWGPQSLPLPLLTPSPNEMVGVEGTISSPLLTPLPLTQGISLPPTQGQGQRQGQGQGVSLPPLPQPQATPLLVGGTSQQQLQQTINVPQLVVNQESSVQIDGDILAEKYEPIEEEYDDFFLSLFSPLTIPTVSDMRDFSSPSTSNLNQQISSPSLGSLSISDLQLQQFLGQTTISSTIDNSVNDEDQQENPESEPSTEISVSPIMETYQSLSSQLLLLNTPTPEIPEKIPQITPIKEVQNPQNLSEIPEKIPQISPIKEVQNPQNLTEIPEKIPQVPPIKEVQNPQNLTELSLLGISPILQAPPQLIQQLFAPPQIQANLMPILQIEPQDENFLPSEEADMFDEYFGPMFELARGGGILPFFPNENYNFEVQTLVGGGFEGERSLWQKVKARDTNDTEFSEQISSFVQMLESSGLVSEICRVKGGVTIFAPINDVFDQMLQAMLILEDDISAFIENMSIVRQIMRYHIIQSKLEKILENESQMTLLAEENVIIEHNEIFGQVLARPQNSTSTFAFIRVLQGYTQLLPCNVKTVQIDAVLYPKQYVQG